MSLVTRFSRLMVLVTTRELALAVLEAGARTLQVRIKGKDDREFLEISEEIVAVAESFGAVAVVNDRPDIARLAGAAGVHLGQTDLAAARVRDEFGPGLAIGVSTHDEAEIRAALAGPADYLGVGTVFASPTRPDRAPDGLAIVRLAARLCPRTPFYAIGGITLENAGTVLEAGAWGIAVASAIAAAPDPRKAAEGFLQTIRVHAPDAVC